MRRLLIVAPVALLVAGCQLANTTPPQASVKAPELPSPPAASSTEAPSPLSYGTATTVKKGVTTQVEIMERFGAPSVMTTDKDGEVWMYEKTSSTVSSSQAQSGSASERKSAAAMALFFGLPPVVGGGAASTSGKDAANVTQGTQQVTQSVKTITFIIKFNLDKTVRDYSVHQAVY